MVFSKYILAIDDVTAILEETGRPAGWYPALMKYNTISGLITPDLIFPSELMDLIKPQEEISLSTGEFLDLRQQLKAHYEDEAIGKQSELDKDGDENEDSEDSFGAYKPIPTETLVEELSQKLKIHPISAYWLIKEGIELEGWRCSAEEKRISADRFTVFVLCMLGHRWPKQIEVGESVPSWADLDGIIPLTPGMPESSLLERVRARLSQEFPGGNPAGLEREFEEIMGESLEKWLSSSFFKHHISQFKKRPIAWQITSRPANSTGGKGKKKGLAKAPAFDCLVYYHKLDHNTLTTLQSQYVRPLRQSYETEMRTLEGLVLLTPDQSSRRIQLEAWIDELKDFESRLERCAREGFTNPALAQVAAKEPLDRWTSRDGQAAQPTDRAEFEAQEMRYDPDLNDGVRVNIAPLQKYGLLAADVLDAKDIEKAIADRAEWRADERRWCRDGKLSKPGWWKEY